MDEIDSNRMIVHEIRERINELDENECLGLLDNIYNTWIYKSNTGNVFDYGKVALKNFGLDENNLLAGQFEEAYKRKIGEITYLHLKFMKDKMDEEDTEFEEDENTRDIKMKFNKIFQSILDAKYAIKSFLFLESSMAEEEYVPTDKDVDLYRFIPMDYSDMSPYQKLLLYLLEQLQHHEYRRYDGECYKQLYTEEGYNTHSWKKAMTLKQFINNVTNKHTNPYMWKCLTSAKDNCKAAAQYLNDYIGSEFEDVCRDRHVFSYKNGIYIAKKYNDEKDIYYDEWIPWGTKTIGNSVVACKYFNETFIDLSNMDWFDIIGTYCKNFKGIMDYQEWPEEVQKWLCIMIGRSMYDLGEIEEWQVIGYLLGQAGSGKSYAADTPILMYDGSIKMVQNLKKGDKLMGDDSTVRNVISCTAGVDMMYKIKQENGMEYVVNGLHELCLKVKCEDYCIINGIKYKKDDIIEINVENYMDLSDSQKKELKGYKVPIDWEEKEVSIDPYILGLSLGNGSSSYIPNIYKINSRNVRLQLLAGLLDSTESTGKLFSTNESFNIIIIQKNKKLAEDIEFIVRSLGFYTKIQECKNEDTYYRMRISGNLEQIPTKVQRKQVTSGKQVKDYLSTSIEIEEYKADYFYGVQLDGNKRMVLGDFTVGHNSTILTKIVKIIYESCDVGVLSNNIEKKFGLSALESKFLFIGPEIKGNLSLEQSEFQSLISGEDLQIAKKMQTATSVVWKVPGMLAGNEVPSYTDNAGSISRRLLVFKFDRKVQKGDTRLGKKLAKELNFIIQACNRAYQYAVNTYGEKDIWNIVPNYFKKTKDQMAENTNALTNFLKSDKVRVSPELYVRERIFVQALKEHCSANNLGGYKWNSDYYLGPFETFKISLDKNKKLKYPNKVGATYYYGSFVMGCDILSDMDNNDFDPEE